MRQKTKQEIIEEIVRKLLKNVKKTAKEKQLNNIVYHKDYYKYLGLEE